MRFLFHVGMGKTGSTAIQAALARSGDELAAARLRYAGMWAPWIGPEHEGPAPFHRFLARKPEGLAEAADLCLAWAEGFAAETGAEGIVHSNESFHAAPFFLRLAERADVRLLAYVRAPALWLPSAFMQWGVVHKTNPGPVAPFGATARRLMNQYRLIRRLGEAVGDRLEVRPYPEGGDVVADFGGWLGVPLRAAEGRQQVRKGLIEAVFRSAFNSGVPGPVVPRVFEEAMGALRGGAPAPASARLARLTDRSELPEVLAENAELIGWFEARIGRDLGAPPVPEAAPGPDELVDGLLGALVELSVAQGREIAELRARLAALEARERGEG